MSSLFNDTPANTYNRLLQIGNSTNSGIGTAAITLQDGAGVNIPIQVSTTGINVTGLFYINGSSGISVSNLFNINTRLLEIAAGENYQMTSSYYNTSGILSSGVVSWPDGGTGLFTTTNFNTGFLAVDGYTLTYGNGVFSRTITQSGISRNISGYVTGLSPLSII